MDLSKKEWEHPKLVLHLNYNRVIVIEHGGERLEIYRNDSNKMILTAPKSFIIYQRKLDEAGKIIEREEK